MWTLCMFKTGPRISLFTVTNGSQMVICDSEKKETGTKSVAMATAQGAPLGIFPKLQL